MQRLDNFMFLDIQPSHKSFCRYILPDILATNYVAATSLKNDYIEESSTLGELLCLINLFASIRSVFFVLEMNKRF